MNIEEYIMFLLQTAHGQAVNGQAKLVEQSMNEAYGAIEFLVYCGGEQYDKLSDWWWNEVQNLFLKEIRLAKIVEWF